MFRWHTRQHQLLGMYINSLNLALFPQIFFMWNMGEELDILPNSVAGSPTILQ